MENGEGAGRKEVVRRRGRELVGRKGRREGSLRRELGQVVETAAWGGSGKGVGGGPSGRRISRERLDR